MDVLISIAAVVIVAWFAGGSIYNVRRASALMRWMQEGLPRIGRRTRVRWLGSTAVQLDIVEAGTPFGTANVVLFLEPRDLPWWPLSHARGRRDTVIVRGTLERPPRLEVEALDPGSWSGRDALARLPGDWLARDVQPVETLAIHGADAEAVACGERLAALARDTGLVVRRLSVRRAEPHFQVHLAWPDVRRGSRTFFDSLGRLALVASQEHDRSP